MTGPHVRFSVVAATGFVCLIGAWVADPLLAESLESIVANDNRVPGGELRDGVLTLRLELRRGVWHPEGEDGEAIPVYAFGEEGKPLQVPGPLVRVPEGTVVEVSVHNTLAIPATLHGLQERPAAAGDVVTVDAGARHEVRFAAGEPGTYLYWARTPDGLRGDRRVADALVGGALVVDAHGAPTDDRIFVLERWNGPTRTAINGKSWPFTERLAYQRGEPVHWRVVNASDLSHPMHLHGLHFNIEGVGVPIVSGMGDMRAPPVGPGQTFVARMTPPRAGTLLYHTHWHDERQLTGGVHGPLIVMPAGRTHDPATDKTFLFSQTPREPFGAAMLLMNGVPQPRTMELATGTKYRFRFMNITPSVANLRVSLRQAGVPVEWRPVAKDAVDLPASQATMRRADLQISVGETYDFELDTTDPVELTLEGVQPNDTRRVVQTLVFTDPPR